MVYDIAILGIGPAGLTATIYGKRYNLNTITFGKSTGGMAAYAPFVENYPGFDPISGIELTGKMQKQAEKLGAEIAMKEVVNISKEKDLFSIQTKDNNKIEAKTIIISLGTEKRKLNIPGESGFLGKGISYCAICDSMFFRDKNVIVIGGNDSAAKAALLLAEKSKKVYISYRKDELRCEKFLLERIKKNAKIEIINNSVPLEIKGSKKVEAIMLEKGGKKEEIKVDGIFVEIGSIPTTNLAKKLKIELNDEGYIKVNDKMETNAEGVFAAGDITASPLKQIITAASQGAIAASSAYAYIKIKR